MAPSNAKPKRRIFSENTLLPVSVVLGVLVPLFCTGIICTWVIAREISKYDSSLTNLTAKVEKVDQKIDSTDKKMEVFLKKQATMSWTYVMMKNFADQAGYLNNGWVVPNYRQIKDENTDLND